MTWSAAISDTSTHSADAGPAWSEPSAEAARKAGRLITSLRAQLELRLGYVPALFDPAFASAEVLEAMWQQTRAAYLDSPLPVRFKEAHLLADMRRFPTAYGLVGHAAALARQGVRAAEILGLLDGLASAAELRRHLDVLCACPEPWTQWPSAATLVDSVLACSIAYALEPDACAGVPVEMRRLLPAELYNRWSALLAYARARWQWCAAYPELAQRGEPALAEWRARLLDEEPRLAAHLSPAEASTSEVEVVRRPLPTPDALGQIIDAVPTGILQLAVDGAVVLSNAPAQRMFGLSAAEFARLTAQDLELTAVGEDGKRLPADAYPMTRCLHTLEPQPPVTLGVRRRDGELVWATVTALPLMDPVAQKSTGVMVTFVDVSERKRTERALRESEAKYQMLVEATDVYVLCLDREGKITRANAMTSRLLGTSSEAMLGRALRVVVPYEEVARAHHARYQHGMETGVNVDVEETIEAQGQTLWFATTVVPLRDHTGEVVGAQIVARDVTSKRRAELALRDREERSRHDALHDPLTRLPNRMLFMDRLEAEMIHARQAAGESRFAVLCLDLDRFKNINDSLGHSAGDRLLIEFGRRLQECIGPEDTLARLGGDEFAILLRSVHDASDAIRVADRVLSLLKQPFPLLGQDVYVPTSVGIAFSASGYEHPEDVLRDADTAMYRAKRRGKGRYELFDAGMHTEAVALLTLENDLRRAIERGEFQVYYQPVIALETNLITGFEALLRWNHPARGIVLPGEFIGCAEETGLIVPIGEWVLREACKQMQRWHEKYPIGGRLSISVNLSGKQFSHPAHIGRALRESSLAPSSLKLEITESVIMEDPSAASKLLEQLQRQEVQSYVDDFGTGYSSLSYLHRFPMSALKIDRSFVTNIGPGGENAAIVQTIVNLAHNLGMSVIAEGVETAAQLELLRQMGCEYGQGFYFSRPVAAPIAEAMIQRQAAQQGDA